MHFGNRIPLQCKFLIPQLPTLLVTNACHISNKIDEQHVVTEINYIDVAIISESWLDNTIPSCVVAIGQSFEIYHKERCTIGGGVLAYVRATISTQRLQQLDDPHEERG